MNKLTIKKFNQTRTHSVCGAVINIYNFYLMLPTVRKFNHTRQHLACGVVVNIVCFIICYMYQASHRSQLIYRTIFSAEDRDLFHFVYLFIYVYIAESSDLGLGQRT